MRAVWVRSDANRGARGRVRAAAMRREGWQAGVELSSCRQRYSQDNVLYHGLIVKVCWLPSTVEEGIERCCDCEPHLCVPLAFQSNLKVPRSTRMNCQMWQIKVFPEYHYVTHHPVAFRVYRSIYHYRIQHRLEPYINHGLESYGLGPPVLCKQYSKCPSDTHTITDQPLASRIRIFSPIRFVRPTGPRKDRSKNQ